MREVTWEATGSAKIDIPWSFIIPKPSMQVRNAFESGALSNRWNGRPWSHHGGLLMGVYRGSSRVAISLAYREWLFTARYAYTAHENDMCSSRNAIIHQLRRLKNPLEEKIAT